MLDSLFSGQWLVVSGFRKVSKEKLIVCLFCYLVDSVLVMYALLYDVSNNMAFYSNDMEKSAYLCGTLNLQLSTLNSQLINTNSK